MGYREDYYKFSHYFLPNRLFNCEGTIINKILRDKNILFEELKTIWQDMNLGDYSLRVQQPNINIEMRKMDNYNSIVVIEIAEVKEELEALYIGIVFDINFKTRYFTYEIGVNVKQEEGYILYECTTSWENINYGFFKDKSIDSFMNSIEQMLVYEMF